MNKLVYKNYVWPQNPDHYQQDYVREPIYARNEAGQTVFTGMGPMKRTITGSGAFFGAEAYTSFEALAALFAETNQGLLIHPVCGNRLVFFTKLQMAQSPKSDYVAYSFEFKETDAEGAIPK